MVPSGALTVARRWGNIARKAAGPTGYWLVLGLITFLGVNAVIKIEATETRLFLVVVVFGVAFGAASLVEHLLRPTDMQPNGEPTDIWPRWYSQFSEPIVYRRSDRVPYSYVVLPSSRVSGVISGCLPKWLNRNKEDHTAKDQGNGERGTGAQ
jgi:hypothetical protein